jgi:hypothetical protein
MLCMPPMAERTATTPCQPSRGAFFIGVHPTTNHQWPSRQHPSLPTIIGHGIAAGTHSVDPSCIAAPRRTLQDGPERFRRQRGWEAMISFVDPTPTSTLPPRACSPLNSHRRHGDRWGVGTSRSSSSPSQLFKDQPFALMPNQCPVSQALNAIFTPFTGFTRFSYLLNFRVHICKGGYGV